jgi:hypothetical protein
VAAAGLELRCRKLGCESRSSSFSTDIKDLISCFFCAEMYCCYLVEHWAALFHPNRQSGTRVGIACFDEIRQRAELTHTIGLKVHVNLLRLYPKRLVDLVSGQPSLQASTFPPRFQLLQSHFRRGFWGEHDHPIRARSGHIHVTVDDGELRTWHLRHFSSCDVPRRKSDKCHPSEHHSSRSKDVYGHLYGNYHQC